MSNSFNLGGYLKHLFSAKKEDSGQQIETKLVEKNKKEEEPQEITEAQLKKDRKDTEENTIEKKLEKVRAGSQEMLTEGQLNKSKSTIMKHRSAEKTAKGDINKLEEKRLAGETMESEKQELASEMDKPKRFYEVKSPDGLKLAKSINIVKVSQFDIDEVDSLNREDEDAGQGDINISDFEDVNVTPSFKEEPSPDVLEELSPGALEELSKFKDADEIDDSEKQAIINDLINDPEMLNELFTEEVVGQDDSTGTMVEERKIEFDLKDLNGEIKDIFKKGNDIDTDVLKKAVVNFIVANHAEEGVDTSSLQVDIDRSSSTGSVTYIVPVE